MKKSIRDDVYPLAADKEVIVEIDGNGLFPIPSDFIGTIFLKFDYIATGREPHVNVYSKDGVIKGSQYFETHQSGVRYLNLSGYAAAGETILISGVDCSFAKKVTLLLFHDIDFSSGNILIVAPHADDAELAAYGLYSSHAMQTWIVTVSAGETLNKLSKQYVPGLDSNLQVAARRKALVRAWNAATTPRLAGVDPDKLVMLGYYNDTLTELLQNPSEIIKSKMGILDKPSSFRSFNRISLQSDETVENCGRHLIADFVELIEYIKPKFVLVTNPELDPHLDHQACAAALAQALKKTKHQPENILLYANHFKHTKYFPFGPEHAMTSLPPADINNSTYGDWKIYSHYLSEETQKAKIIALDTMHDLRATLSFEKKLKRKWQQLWRKKECKYYAAHHYFQTAIKSQEVFVVVSSNKFAQVNNDEHCDD